jgi:hypothetical protein
MNKARKVSFAPRDRLASMDALLRNSLRVTDAKETEEAAREVLPQT